MLDPKLRNNSFDFAAQINPDPALVLRTLSTAREVTGDDLTGVAAGTVVKVRGRVHPGPGGLLTAPLSGQPCVWHRSAFFPGREFAPVPSVAPSDGPPAINVGPDRRVMNPSEEISTAPFGVGGHRGEVTVDPLIADVDTDVLAANQMWTGEHAWSGGLMVEWILPPGAEVIALGRVGVDRSLQAAADVALLVSTKDEGRIVARDQPAAGRDAHGSTARVIRMQKMSNRAARYSRTMRLASWIIPVLFALALLITALVK